MAEIALIVIIISAFANLIIIVYVTMHFIDMENIISPVIQKSLYFENY